MRTVAGLHPNPNLAHYGFSPSFEDRFWDKVLQPENPEECWIWIGAKRRGYGRLGRCGTPNPFYWHIDAHVASWIIHFGIVPDGLNVLHNCPGGDRRDCVNPLHLWLGTNAENSADAVLKGRSHPGEEARDHKLTWLQVREIRSRYADGGTTHRELGLLYGIHAVNIGAIIRNEHWIERQP